MSYVVPAGAFERRDDPVTGRSVWLAGMIRHPREKDGDLHFDVVFTAQHGPSDRAGIVEALTANLKGLGFDGRVRALHAGELPAKPGAPRTSLPPRDEPRKKKPTVPGNVNTMTLSSPWATNIVPRARRSNNAAMSVLWFISCLLCFRECQATRCSSSGAV